MKTIIRVFLTVCFLTVFTIACKKNENIQRKSTLTLSSEIVKIGQPLEVASNKTDTGLITKWSVSPSGKAWVSPSGNKSVILFFGAGNYRVTATYFTDSSALTPYDSSFSPVVVNDNIYGEGKLHCLLVGSVLIKTNDEITLTPLSFSDTGLVLFAHTQQLYGNNLPGFGNNTLTDNTGMGYNFSFARVDDYPCELATPDPEPATGIFSFKGLGNGVHKVAFSLNGNNYTGSVTVTDTDCTFAWNYVSGIIISPLHILKQ
ncbi:MAG: hypothetical protein ABI372_03520 [Ginsengibacter sp.]